MELEVIRNSLPYCVFPISRKIYSNNIYRANSFYIAECNNIEILQTFVN